MKQNVQANDGSFGLRERLNSHPGFTALGIGCLVALALFFALKPRYAPVPKAYFTTDDGQTFVAMPFRLTPFEMDGRTAVQAVVFTADRGASRFVGYLQRFTPKGQTEMAALLGEHKTLDGPMPADWYEVKKPGPNEPWVSPVVTSDDIGKRMGEAARKGPAALANALKAQRTFTDVMHVVPPNGKGTAVMVGADDSTGS